MENVNKQENEFYARQSAITDPGGYEPLYGCLPDSPQELLNAVHGLVVHIDHAKLYGVTFSKKQTDDELLRTTAQLLERVTRINAAPLDKQRTPNERFVGMCRDSALLFVSFLRAKGIPARVRAGFADYFKSEVPLEDHWLAEYYSDEQKRWVRVDAQLDAPMRELYEIKFDSMDMPEAAGFLTGGQAWTLCRSGERHQEDFGFNKAWCGWASVKANLLHDFDCLLGLELLPWDLWTELAEKKYAQLARAEKDLLDDMALLTAEPSVSFADVSMMAKRMPPDYMPAINSQLRLLEVTGRAKTLDPDSLEQKFEIEEADAADTAQAQIRESDAITATGCRQNNLKNIDVSIPKGKLTVVTGVSGSGKSSLAFDTIYAEGRRRYLENMSGAARLSEQLEKPDFDSIKSLTPTIAIEQKKGSQNPRSSVGTLTGIFDQLRMLFSALGTPHCPYCGAELVKHSKSKNRCPVCGELFARLTGSMFNANTHSGACHSCNGLGYTYDVDPSLIVPFPNLSLLDGASTYFGKQRGKKPTGNWMVGELFVLAENMGIDLDTPYESLPQEFKNALLYGMGEKIYTFRYNSGGRNTELSRPVQGAVAHINRLFRENKSEDNVFLQFMKKTPCPVCHGELLCVEARYTSLFGYRFPELTKMPVTTFFNWAKSLESRLDERQRALAQELVAELESRTANLIRVGLSYLTLDRSAPTLSGGELQRVRLSSQLGSDLTGLTYILDEPSIGLHPRDHALMINAMKRLRDKGNTVIVVEHDRDTMLAADSIIDIGPGAGIHGGTIVSQGTPAEVMQDSASVTGRYLSGAKKFAKRERRVPRAFLTLRGCTGNNLKNIDVSIPLHTLCCVTGVSGSGKSTLIFKTLVPALEAALAKRRLPDCCTGIEGFEGISGLVEMDQSPAGKTARSVAATYIGAFDPIRALFAAQPSSQAAGFGENHFSFNSKIGQCPVCEGQGVVKTEFLYMADHYTVCPECKGARYREEVLDVHYSGRSIAEVLRMDVSEAAAFFKDAPDIARPLELLCDVGLSYLKLGQRTCDLSGGEAQRLKLARELGQKQKKHMLYVLDEPTTGLHFQDVERLLAVLQRLVDAGHSLIVVEHNMDMARAADYIIDLGPDGGSGGGSIAAEGTPEHIAACGGATGKYIAGGIE